MTQPVYSLLKRLPKTSLVGLSRLPKTSLVGLFLGLIVVLGACEDSVNPFVEDDRFYSIYGYLDTASDKQYVRVVPLRTDFGSVDSQEIDATVTTTDMTTGEVLEWTHTIVTLSDGTRGHVYEGPFRPIPEHTYQFKVERSDGVTTTASTTIPPPTEFELQDPVITPNTALQRVRWHGLDFSPFRVEIWYRFLNPLSYGPYLDAILVYGEERFGAFQPVGSRTWETLIQLTADKEDVTQELGVSGDAEPTLAGIGIRLTMTDDQWRPPDGVFNREILVQPGTFSNVENGFGFLGSVNQYTAEWMVSEAVVQRMGYSYPQ